MEEKASVRWKKMGLYTGKKRITEKNKRPARKRGGREDEKV